MAASTRVSLRRRATDLQAVDLRAAAIPPVAATRPVEVILRVAAAVATARPAAAILLPGVVAAGTVLPAAEVMARPAADPLVADRPVDRRVMDLPPAHRVARSGLLRAAGSDPLPVATVAREALRE